MCTSTLLTPRSTMRSALCVTWPEPPASVPRQIRPCRAAPPDSVRAPPWLLSAT